MARRSRSMVISMHGQDTAVVATSGDEESEPQLLLSVDAAARILGGITRREVYRRLDDEDLEGVWIGRRRMVVRASVDAYVERLRAEARARKSDPPQRPSQPPTRPPQQPEGTPRPGQPPRKLQVAA